MRLAFDTHIKEIDMSDQAAAEQLQRYYRIWTEKSAANDLSAMLDAIAMMKMSVDQLLEPHSFAKAALALVCYDTCVMIVQSGQDQRFSRKLEQCFCWIMEYADKALVDDPLEFRAQFIKTVVASDDFAANNTGIGDLVANAKRERNSFMKGFSFGKNAVTSLTSRRSYQAELDKLLHVYTEGFATYYKSFDEFLECSAKLLLFADFAEQQRVGDPKKVLQAVLSVKLDDLEYPENAEPAQLLAMKAQVNDLVQMIRAKSMVS